MPYQSIVKYYVKDKKLFNWLNKDAGNIIGQDNLPKNNIIKIKDINFKKPGTGVPASELDKILGKKLKKKYKKNEFFVLKDLI